MSEHAVQYFEVNFDGLVGPTHNYAGLALGNLASQKHAHEIANPLAAVKQGIEKMRLLQSLGVKQALLPPHARPNIPFLKALGFSGTDQQIIEGAYKSEPQLLAACYSASSMWTANAATVCPSNDSLDHKVHFTPANLISNLHRCQESAFTRRVLQNIFFNEKYFIHHKPLAAVSAFADEGAANHNRLCASHAAGGLQIFVYGRHGIANDILKPTQYPARQTQLASRAIARLHQLPEQQIIFAQQNPQVIDQGVFHNDVISVANENVFLFHEYAFVEDVIEQIKNKFNGDLYLLEVKNNEIEVSTAVSSYLFNSQVITVDDHMIILAPSECEQNLQVKKYIDTLIVADNPINQVYYIDCRQSMKNGGGPACLRLRMVLNTEEINASHSGVYLDDDLYHKLLHWADKHYRDQMTEKDLLDPQLITESYNALDQLTQLLELGSIYYFQ